MDGEGVDIDEADPEAKLIDWSSPKSAYTTTREAIAAKQRRVANASLPVTGGQASINPIANINDPSELLKMGLKRR
jgi:hypothetical protein